MDAYFWDEVTPQAKNQIKGSLLNALMFPEVLLMRCGASILSQIAAIEIPRGEWLSIVDILA